MPPDAGGTIVGSESVASSADRRSISTIFQQSRVTIYLATSRKRPDLTPSDSLLRLELEGRGCEVIAAPWDAIDPLDGSLVCIRSAWDYHLRPGEFEYWIKSLRPGARLVNPAETVLWNMDKLYLREIAERGIPIPTTRWYAPGERPDFKRFLKEAGAECVVLKPRISATAFGTHLLNEATELSSEEWKLVTDSGAVLQAFVPEVRSEGEISLIYFAGRFSHAVRKRTASGDFRVQSDFGGSLDSMFASPALRTFGEKVLEAARHAWLYARVDLIETSNGPILMELELIEPDLFLGHAAESAKTMAGALLAE